MVLQHTLGEHVELRDPKLDVPVWRYVYSASKPKPHFYPICTPGGFNVGNYEPHDHPWHRGLWFTIKLLNEENFWEENPPFGVQRTPLPPTVSHGEGGSIAVSSELKWMRPQDKGLLINEQRSFTYRPIDETMYALDFSTKLTPVADVLLDRTPFTTWGGYGGLILRGNRNWIETRILFPDGSTSDRPAPKPAAWADLSGKRDGGWKLDAGFAMFDHPSNVRHPVPWYGTVGAGHYLNAAFLFNETMTLRAGQTLALKYRVLLHDGMMEKEQIQAEYDRFVAREHG